MSLQETFTNIFGFLQSPKHQSARFTENLFEPRLPLLLYQRGLTHTVYGHGASVRPNRPCRGGGGVPSGSLNLKACSKLVTVRNSSIFASCSPMHTLRPIPNGIKHSFLSNFPSPFKKRVGLKLSGSSHTVGSLWTDHRLGKTTVPLGIV